MNNAAAFDWAERSLRLDRKDPYLRVQFVPIFVRDLDRSIQFFVEQLGFSVIMDTRPTNLDIDRRQIAKPRFETREFWESALP